MRLPDHIWVRPKPRDPECVTDHGDGALVFGHREATQNGTRTQRGEEALADKRHARSLGAIADPKRLCWCEVGRDVLEQVGLFAVLNVELQPHAELPGSVGTGPLGP